MNDEYKVGQPFNPYRRLVQLMVPKTLAECVAISRLAKLLYAWLQFLKGPDSDRCRVHQARLGSALGVSVDTIARGLKELVDSGLLKIERRGRGNENVYIFLFCELLRGSLRVSALESADVRVHALEKPDPAESRGMMPQACSNDSATVRPPYRKEKSVRSLSEDPAPLPLPLPRKRGKGFLHFSETNENPNGGTAFAATATRPNPEPFSTAERTSRPDDADRSLGRNQIDSDPFLSPALAGPTDWSCRSGPSKESEQRSSSESELRADPSRSKAERVDVRLLAAQKLRWVAIYSKQSRLVKRQMDKLPFALEDLAEREATLDALENGRHEVFGESQLVGANA